MEITFETILIGMIKPEITSEGFVGIDEAGAEYHAYLNRKNGTSIVIAPKDQFKTDEAYYAALFHELIHFARSTITYNNTTKKFWELSESEKKIAELYEEVVAERGAIEIMKEAGVSRTTKERLEYYENGKLDQIICELETSSQMKGAELEKERSKRKEDAINDAKQAIRSLLSKQIVITSLFENQNAEHGKEVADKLAFLK